MPASTPNLGIQYPLAGDTLSSYPGVALNAAQTVDTALSIVRVVGHAWRNTNTNIGNALWLGVPVDLQDDPLNTIGSTGVFQAPIAGWYMVDVTCQFNSPGGSTRFIGLQPSGIGNAGSGPNVRHQLSSSTPRAVGSTTLAGSAIVKLGLNDTVTLVAFQDSGGTMAVGAASLSVAGIRQGTGA